MARGIYEVHGVIVVLHADRLEFDGDATLLFEIHSVEMLRIHLSFFDRAGNLKKSIREGRFAMINVGDDAEVSNVVHIMGALILPQQSIIIKTKNDHSLDKKGCVC